MQIRMQNAEELSGKQIEAFLKGSEAIRFTGQNRVEKYAFVQEMLVGQEYALQGKKERGDIRAYLSKVTGLSLPQMTRLIRQYRQQGTVRAANYRRHRFTSKYTAQDVKLLAEVDRAHDWLSGPATVHILGREYERYQRKEYARLAEISVAHLYNLRRSEGYRRVSAQWERTKASAVGIGERRKPDPQGRPGFLRVNTVHQGDWEGVKGVYHINAVDAVTQWQVVGCVARISEQFLLPVLEAMLHQFPFRILGMHTDNGSEYVNYEVAGLLKRLLIEFTKSRANRTQDNGWWKARTEPSFANTWGTVTSEPNTPRRCKKFYTAHLNPYLNFHRPCGYATVSLDSRGKRKRQYKYDDYATPWEKLRSMEKAEKHLKEALSLAQLEQAAAKMSDTECARKMATAKTQLLRRCKMESPERPKRNQ